MAETVALTMAELDRLQVTTRTARCAPRTTSRAQAPRRRLRLDRRATAETRRAPTRRPETHPEREAADPGSLGSSNRGCPTRVKRPSLLWAEADTSTVF